MTCPKCGSFWVKAQNDEYRLEGHSEKTNGTRTCQDCGHKHRFWKSARVAGIPWPASGALAVGTARCAGK